MFKHFVGRVIVFNPEPKSAELTVDVPVVSQSENMSDELLLQYRKISSPTVTVSGCALP